MKGVKAMLGGFAAFVCVLFLVPCNVDAAYIDSVDALKEVFDGKNAIIEGTTITLTGDVELKSLNSEEGSDVLEYDIVEFFGGNDFVLNLNGYTLTAHEIYINDGSLTINDLEGEGKIETIADFLMVVDGAKLVINNGTIDYLANEGNAIVNNGAIDFIVNYGVLTIENGSFGSLGQMGDATINGGTFTASSIEDEWGVSERYSLIELDSGKTILKGGEFKTSNFDYSLVIQSGKTIDGNSINQVVADGYIAVYGEYKNLSSDSYVDEETGETIYLNVGSYTSVKIIKDETDAIYNKVAPNGVWTINSAKPNSMENSDFLLSAIVGDVEIPDGYELMAWCESGEEFDPEKVSLNLYYNGHYLGSKIIKAVYNEPSSLIQENVDSVINKIDEYTKGKHSIETSFRLEDLYLINYLNASSKGIDPSLALNFSKDLINLTNGGNMSYKYDSRLGSFSPTGLWHHTGGQVIVYQDDIAVNTTKIGLTTNHVLYVSNDTLDTDEARIDAALKRIEEYFGDLKGITIKVGGTFESLNTDDYTWNQYNFIDEKTSGSNYYDVTINGKTYKFAICKKEIDQLETPEYFASDVSSKIYVKSNSSELPLDTAISVKNVVNDDIEKSLGTKDYAAYDISLYSNAKQVNITKLEEDNFVVSIPVPELLKNKKIAAFYVNDEGEKEEHDVVVKDDYVSFETNHFSTYVLVEKIEVENPNTLDNISSSIIMSVISLVGLGCTVLYLKKQKVRA